MKPRLSVLTLLALLFFSWNASAQARRGPQTRRPAAEKTAPRYGSVERTKLLDQVNSRTVESRRLGSVERRAALTGAHVRVNKPRHQRRR